MTDDPHGFYQLWDCGVEKPALFGLFGGFATVEQLHDLDDAPAVIAHVDATFRKLAVAYGHLLGIRPIRLVFDTDDVDRFRGETEAINARIAAVAASTGLPLRADTPCLLLRASIAARALAVDLAASEPLNDAGLWRDFVERSRCLANHVTRAFHLPLAAAFADHAARAVPLPMLERLARAVFAYADKGVYLRSLASPDGPILDRAPTILCDLGGPGAASVRHDDLHATLAATAGTPVARGRLFLKPVRSGGGVGVHMLAPGGSIDLPEAATCLVQADVDPGDAEARGGLPGRIGINLRIAADGTPHIQAITTQLYRDPHCLSHIGSLLDADVAQQVGALIGRDRILGHARLLHARGGIAGPVGLDLVYDRHRGSYVDIVDANIRLTASAPVALFHRVLERRGARIRSVAIIGNEGLLPLAEDTGLDMLGKAGLLYAHDGDGGTGLVPVPSYAGPARFDPAFVNCDLEAMRTGFAALRGLSGAALPEIFDAPDQALHSPMRGDKA